MTAKFTDCQQPTNKVTFPYDQLQKREMRICEQNQSFVVDSGILFHKRGQRLCHVVTDPRERDRFVTQLHADPASGSHYRQTATIQKVTDRFQWENVAVDTRAFVRKCAVCQKANLPNKAASASYPIPVTDLCHRWGIDLVGPLKETKKATSTPFSQLNTELNDQVNCCLCQ